MTRMIHNVYDKTPASQFPPVVNAVPVVHKGRTYVKVSEGMEKYSKCKSYLKVVGLFYAVVYSFGFALCWKKVRANLAENIKAYFAGERMVKRFARI